MKPNTWNFVNFQCDNIHIYFTKKQEIHVHDVTTGTRVHRQLLLFFFCFVTMTLVGVPLLLHWNGNQVTRKLSGEA